MRLMILYLGLNDRSGYLHLKKLTRTGDTIVGVITHPPNIKHRLLSIMARFIRLFHLKGYSFQVVVNHVKYEVSKIAKEHKLPLFLINDVNSDSFFELCISLKPDVIVVGSWDERIPPRILIRPRLGCINSHPSYLPKHRGASPNIGAILSDEKESGATIHYMDGNFDTGDIILQKRLKILDNDTGYSLLGRLSELGSEILIEALRLIKNGKVAEKPQGKGTYDRAWRWKRDGRIDWNKTSREIYNLIRAASYPNFLGLGGGAYTIHCVKILKIWEAYDLKEEYVHDDDDDLLAGTILKIRRDGFIVKCGHGAILVKTVQRDGILHKRISAANYARKSKVLLKERFI